MSMTAPWLGDAVGAACLALLLAAVLLSPFFAEDEV
jgi:hypothetical protein